MPTPLPMAIRKTIAIAANQTIILCRKAPKLHRYIATEHVRNSGNFRLLTNHSV
jgi:hypothetical protein